MSGNEEVRRYLTDDRDDEPGRRHELVIFPGGNGDWYLGVWPEGARGSPNTVRLCTSGGASSAAPMLPICAARMYRALGPKQEPVELPAVGEVGCKHEVVLPLGTGFGRCQACGDESFPMTEEAGGQCGSCGTYGECSPECDGVPRRPWALAKQALENLRFVYSGPVPSTVDFTVEMLRRITGEIRDVVIPGHFPLTITFDGAEPKLARWRGSAAAPRDRLSELGMVVDGVVVRRAGRSPDQQWFEIQVRKHQRGW